MDMMKAAVLHAPNDLRYEDVPIPEPGPGDVLVRVTACGVCGSDLPRVLTSGTYHFPTIPGHEFGGIVASAGENVDPGVIGKRVSVIPLIPCRTCKLCEVGQFAQCEQYDFLGSRSDDSASMLEPISVAQHAIRLSGMKPGDNIAVFGLGAIGMFVAQWAKAFGANHVFAIDVDPQKIAIAKACGLEDAVCCSKENATDAVLTKTGGIGVDVAVEASGAVSAFSQAIDLLRTSGMLALVGRPAGDGIIPNKSYEKLLRGQLRVQGCWSFAFHRFPHHDWEESMRALASKKILTTPLITHRFPLSSTYDAIQMMASRSEFVHKILIKPEL